MLALALASCAPSAHELAVDVYTDFAAGVEFDEIHVTVDDANDVHLAAIVPHDDFGDPAHIADYHGLSSGYHRVVAELMLAHHPVAHARGNAWVLLDGTVLVPIGITRSCLLTMCPTSENPAATECFGGACVEPTCDPTVSSCMGDECQDAPCPMPEPGQCIEIPCVRGACLRIPRDEHCLPTQYCDPGSGTCAYLPGQGPTEQPVVTATADASAASITVTWNDIGSTNYRIEFSSSPTFATNVATRMARTFSETFTDIGGVPLEGGKTYYARVQGTDANATVSNVAHATTAIAAPTHVSFSVTDGGVRQVSDGGWITSPGPPRQYHCYHAHASATCASGHPEYYFTARYLPSGGGPWSTGWQTSPDSWIVDTISGYRAVYTMSARCINDVASANAPQQSGCQGSGC